MQLLDDIDHLPAGLRFVVAVGMFDGVHRGHVRMLRSCVRAACRLGARPVVVTFDPHPEQVLRGISPPLLCDPADKLELLDAAGIAKTVAQRFDLAFAEQSAADFLRRLARGRQLAAVVMSPETAFGRDRGGTLAAVEALSAELGFEVVHVPQVMVGGRRVSSGRIREAVTVGRLAEARRLLGRNYAVVGEVVHGDHRGRHLGFPTANLHFDAPVVLPPNGIYAVRVAWGGKDPLSPARRAAGVASLGVRPTFGEGERLLEVHLFDFDGDLYGERLRVEFVRRQRGERRYRSVDALVRQMERDANRAKSIMALEPRLRRSARYSKGVNSVTTELSVRSRTWTLAPGP
jgi:riboflavin kinase/FMN adenylyltransferase